MLKLFKEKLAITKMIIFFKRIVKISLSTTAPCVSVLRNCS